MRLTQDHTAALQARRYARRWSSEHHLAEESVADLELVVDELVGNAVRHALPPYDLELSRRIDGTIRGEICDGSVAAPVPNPAPDYRGGFGLRIVDARTSRWGSATQLEGKQVWFEIASPTI
jgi:two-component sensor histidine kinase